MDTVDDLQLSCRHRRSCTLSQRRNKKSEDGDYNQQTAQITSVLFFFNPIIRKRRRRNVTDLFVYTFPAAPGWTFSRFSAACVFRSPPSSSLIFYLGERKSMNVRRRSNIFRE